MRARQGLAILVAALVVAPPTASAADAQGTITGLVKSTAGSPLGQIDVQFVDISTGVARSVRTDAAGTLQASLDPGSYSVETPGQVIVRGPRTISVKAGEPTMLDLTLQDPGAAAAPPAAGAAAQDGGRRAANITALALFSGALAGVVIYAATTGHEDRKPPTTSGSR